VAFAYGFVCEIDPSEPPKSSSTLASVLVLAAFSYQMSMGLSKPMSHYERKAL
jgi:hypothetical protein